MSAALLEQVDDGYGRRRPALRGVDVAIGPGLTVVTGANGSGKSTLLALLATARMPRAGKAHVLGVPLRRGTPLTDVRRRLAYLPQVTAVAGRTTVAELVDHLAVLRGRTGAARGRAVAAALDVMGLRSFATERVDQLPAGLARAVLCGVVVASDAELLVLDEPFVGLDRDHARRLRDRLGELRAAAAVVVATHHPERLDGVADARIHLVEGRLVEGRALTSGADDPEHPSR